MIPLVVYIAGPYRAPTENGIFENIMTARTVAAQWWAAGAVVICPHTNTFFMGGVCTNDEFIERDLEIVRRCDAIVMLPGSEKSQGATAERAEAVAKGLPVFDCDSDISLGVFYDASVDAFTCYSALEAVEYALHKRDAT